MNSIAKLKDSRQCDNRQHERCRIIKLFIFLFPIFCQFRIDFFMSQRSHVVLSCKDEIDILSDSTGLCIKRKRKISDKFSTSSKKHLESFNGKCSLQMQSQLFTIRVIALLIPEYDEWSLALSVAGEVKCIDLS